MLTMVPKSPMSEDPAKLARQPALMASQRGRVVVQEEISMGTKNGQMVICHGSGSRVLVVVTEHRGQMAAFTFGGSAVVFEAWLPTVKRIVGSIEWTD